MWKTLGCVQPPSRNQVPFCFVFRLKKYVLCSCLSFFVFPFWGFVAAGTRQCSVEGACFGEAFVAFGLRPGEGLREDSKIMIWGE